jgi:hypothetical protein
MSAIANELPELSLNKIIIDSVSKAMQKVLEHCAKSINDNFESLSQFTDPAERLEAIVTLFGLDGETTTKIVKPKRGEKSKTTKAKAEKKLLVPLFYYATKVNGKTVQRDTSNPELCQGLTAGLYSQCPEKPKEGCQYCKKCQKEADANDGMPKRGNVEMRLDQLATDAYKFTPPGSKTAKKIYPLQYALQKGFTTEQFDQMLTEFNMTENSKAAIKFIPEKKGKAKANAKKNLTKDMSDEEETPKGNTIANLPPVPADKNNDEDGNDDDDARSTYSDATQATDFPTDDEGENDDEDEDDQKVEPLIIDIKDYHIIDIDDVKYGALKTTKESEVPYDIHEVVDYVEEKVTTKNGKQKTLRTYKLKQSKAQYDPNNATIIKK